MARPEPEPPRHLEPDLPRLWKVRTKEGQVYKPAPEEKLIALLKAGKLKPDVEVSDPEGGPWISVLEVPAFSRVLG
jgi:hypothetical protein